MSDRNTGYRRVINLGNTNHRNSWTIKGLDSAQTYYWSVQATDNAFAGSNFAPEKTFSTGITTTHFIPVWTGNPYLPMNISVTGADLLGGGSLGAGDEIGIFDAQYCVGAGLLTGPISQSAPLVMIASMDNPATPEKDGFAPGDTIIYRFWLASDSTEMTEYVAFYTIGEGIFISQGSAELYFISIRPVELTTFTAEISNRNIILKWGTATEINNLGFNVERRINEGDWNSIAFIDGYGNSITPKEYSYTDKDLFAGGSRFHNRLKQVDTDGSFSYSDVVEVEVVPDQYELSQNFPNPFNPIEQ